ncbi:hypothetical protein ES703_81088 [subsurface metagenome]
MVKYRFPYAIRDGKSYPMIRVFVGYGKKWADIYALLDSGASISLFTRELGEKIGLDIEKGIKDVLGGIGNGMVVYKHKINLKVRDEIFKIEAAFSKERFFDINIIGRKDFFNKMNITFARDKEIVIEII